MKRIRHVGIVLEPLVVNELGHGGAASAAQGMNNGTTVTTDFGGMVAQLGSAIIVIPLIGILESVAIAKAFGEQIISFLSYQSLIYSCSEGQARGR